MMNLSDFLDADWARLTSLSQAPLRPRRLWHSFTPRFAPVSLLRFAQFLYSTRWKRLAKLPALANFILFGLEVPPRTKIGPGFVIMHSQGTVIGAANIGSNVTIYHQVTLGARDIDFTYTLSQRPIVEDGVVIGAGAKVLGGVTLGSDCIIGANAVVVKDVPPSYVAVGIPARNLPPKTSRFRVPVAGIKHD
jgi:serine O-acetyltransferase